MKYYTTKNALKQILIKWKLLAFIQPIYRTIASFLPEKAHQKKMFNFYSLFIKKGDLCFDIGAHRGNRVASFLRLGARVIAIEPQKNCIKFLQSKFGKNPNFTLVEKGLAESKGKLTMSICEKEDALSTFSEKWKMGRFSNHKWNKKRLVQVTTLDALIKRFGLPVFCKIDVEGFEYQVLKGLSQPIKYISFEFTKDFFDDMIPCLNYLFSLGYTQFNCSIGESMQLLFPVWVTAEDLLRELNLIEDSLLCGDIYARFF